MVMWGEDAAHALAWNLDDRPAVGGLQHLEEAARDDAALRVLGQTVELDEISIEQIDQSSRLRA